MTCSKTYTPLLAITCIIGLYILLRNVNANYVVEHIPHAHIVAVVVLYAVYYMMYLLCFDIIWRGGWIKRVIGAVWVGLLYWTLFPMMYKLIQEWMPLVGLQLFDDTVPYDEAEFRKRLISPYIIVVSMAAVTFAAAQLIRHHRERIQLQKKLADVQQQFLKREIKTHFINNILSSNIGVVLLQSKPDQKKKIRAMVELLGYFNKMDQANSGLVKLKTELAQLKHFMEMINQHYREGTIICTGIDNLKKAEDDIPLGLLLLPLENCLKYARLDPKFPIRYDIRGLDEGWVISCVNYMDWKRAEAAVRTGTGMEMAEKQITALKLPIHIAVQQDEEKFFFTININKL